MGMNIVLLGGGCMNCRNLEKAVFDALAELDLDAAVDVVQDADAIRVFGVPALPALLINGTLQACGRVPHTLEIRRMLAAAAEKTIQP
jgi:hypothetical protein